MSPRVILNELERMRKEAEDRPLGRGRLADRATRAGQALGQSNIKTSDEWFALAAEIRAMGTNQIVGTRPQANVTEVAKLLVPFTSDLGEDPEEPVVEDETTPIKDAPQFHVGRPSKHDQNIEGILLDYGQMTVRALERKWDISPHGFYKLRQRWEARGRSIPLAPVHKTLPKDPPEVPTQASIKPSEAPRLPIHPLPAFKDDWPAETQVKWLDIWLQLHKLGSDLPPDTTKGGVLQK